MNAPHTVRWIAAALALGLAVPSPARADTPTSEEGAPATIGLDIKVIAATDAAGTEDARLKLLLPRLKGFPFKSYKLLAESSVTLDLKAEGTVTLPGNRTLVLRPKSFEKSGRLRVGVNLRNAVSEQVVQADVAVQPGGDVFIGGPKADEGTLIIHVRHARTTQK